MSMRARLVDDYDDKSGAKPMQGEQKNTMNQMFDRKAQQQEDNQAKFFETLNDSKASFDRKLYGDWLL